MKTTVKEVEDYLDKNGFWFNSNSTLSDEATEEAISKGIIQSIENLGVGYPDVKKSHFYVRGQLKNKKELPISMYRHFILRIPC